MHLGMSQSQILQQRQRLSHTHKQGLKYLLSLSLSLTDPPIQYPAKGFEGMQTAHKILKERNSVGVLIGGLSLAVWNKNSTKEQLQTHKDVDVMVLDDKFYINEKFEGGVDWWLPHQEIIAIRSQYSTIQGRKQKWWANSNGITLSFGAQKNYDLNPGMYIPSNTWVIDMKKNEVSANLDERLMQGEVD